MRTFLKLIWFGLLSSGFTVSVFARTNSIPCTYPAITNALATAQEGDVVLIQPGSCVISNTVTVNRNTSFTIRGSGTNQTTLISSGIGGAVFWIVTDSTHVFTISDLNCVGHAKDSYGFFTSGNNPPGVPMKGPMHYYNIQMTNLLFRGISIGGGNSFGLIDHCYMKSRPGNPQFINFDGNEYGSWTNSANPIGTTNVCCVEDCYFDNGTNNGNGFFDAYNGAQLVFRNNFCTGNAPSGVHGYDSGTASARTWEIYNNVFTNLGGILCLQMRGGTGVVFSNQVYGAGSLCDLAYYRSCLLTHSYISGVGTPGQSLLVHFDSQPTNNQIMRLGFTAYTFKSTYTTGGNDFYGGGNVTIGADVANTVTNLFNCVNLGRGAGTAYAASAKLGHDFIAIGLTATDLILKNVLDGNTDAYGYPANQQEGVLVSFKLTSTNFVNQQVLLPCYAWGNTLAGTNRGFGLQDNISECGYNITNLVKLNRDYFNDVIPTNYTPLVYPHPLQALESGGGSNATNPPPAQVLPPSSLIAIPPAIPPQ